MKCKEIYTNHTDKPDVMSVVAIIVFLLLFGTFGIMWGIHVNEKYSQNREQQVDKPAQID